MRSSPSSSRTNIHGTLDYDSISACVVRCSPHSNTGPHTNKLTKSNVVMNTLGPRLARTATYHGIAQGCIGGPVSSNTSTALATPHAFHSRNWEWSEEAISTKPGRRWARSESFIAHPSTCASTRNMVTGNLPVQPQVFWALCRLPCLLAHTQDGVAETTNANSQQN
jgi:hypothetical protein